MWLGTITRVVNGMPYVRVPDLDRQRREYLALASTIVDPVAGQKVLVTQLAKQPADALAIVAVLVDVAPATAAAPLVVDFATGGGSGTFDADLPTLSNGQRLVLFAQYDRGYVPATLTAPAGWTLLRSITYRYATLLVWTRVVDGTESAAVTLTSSDGGSTSITTAYAVSPCNVMSSCAVSDGFEANRYPTLFSKTSSNLLLLAGWGQSGGSSVELSPAAADYQDSGFVAARYSNPGVSGIAAAGTEGPYESFAAVGVALEAVAEPTWATVYTSTASSVVTVINDGDGSEVIVPGLDTGSALTIDALTRITLDLKASGNHGGVHKWLLVRVRDGGLAGNVITQQLWEEFYSDSDAGVERRWQPVLSFRPTTTQVVVTLQSVPGPAANGGTPKISSAQRTLLVEQEA